MYTIFPKSCVLYIYIYIYEHYNDVASYFPRRNKNILRSRDKEKRGWSGGGTKQIAWLPAHSILLSARSRCINSFMMTSSIPSERHWRAYRLTIDTQWRRRKAVVHIYLYIYIWVYVCEPSYFHYLRSQMPPFVRKASSREHW